MKHTLSTLAAMAALIGTAVSAPRVRERQDGDVWVRTVLHDDDGTRTVSKKDKNVKELVMQTYSANDILLQQSKFELDSRGRFVRGQILDRNNRLMFNCEFFYNNEGRLTEERVTDAAGLPVRRLFYQYDRLGNPKGFSLDFRGGKSVGTPVAIADTNAYSATGDRGFQLKPGASSSNSQASSSRPGSSRSSQKSSSGRKLRLFKKDSKRKFRLFKKR